MPEFLQLEILNLASLDKQGGEVINFEEGALGESTIFSIVRSDGKWQVYLLDAICLALYNRALATPGRKATRTRTSRFSELPMPAKVTNQSGSYREEHPDPWQERGLAAKLTFLATTAASTAQNGVRFQRVRYENAKTASKSRERRRDK